MPNTGYLTLFDGPENQPAKQTNININIKTLYVSTSNHNSTHLHGYQHRINININITSHQRALGLRDQYKLLTDRAGEALADSSSAEHLLYTYLGDDARRRPRHVCLAPLPAPNHRIGC